MILRATIFNVMETWPLRLHLRADGADLHVSLTDQTHVVEQGEHRSPGQLRPGQDVQIDVEELANGALLARTIEILGRSPAA